MPDPQANRSHALAPTATLVALVAGLLLAACDGGGWGPFGAPAPTPAPLVPSIRLTGARFVTGGIPAVSGGEYVTIDGVIRPTFTGTQAFLFKPQCRAVEDDPEMVDCQLVVPEKFPPAPWAAALIPIAPSAASHADEGPAHGGDEHEGDVHEGGPEQPGSHGAAGAHEDVRAYFRRDEQPPRTVRVPKAASSMAVARLAPGLEMRTVLSPPMTLPGGGVLRTWIGVEEPAWDERATPVVFTVSRIPAGADEKIELFRREVDPFANEADRTWIPVEIPLEDRGDEAFRLVFEVAPRDGDDGRTSLPVWGDPTILRPEGQRRRPRRVVLISLDTLRARSMSAYGYPLSTTPNFEALLREGTLFEHAYTTYSNTLGSHMSMMTGLYPATHQVLGMNQVLKPVIPTLAERMRDAGYETAAFTENALLRAAAGFQRGFARYYENTGIESGAGDAEGTFRRALEWVERQPDEPLFLFVHTYEVHAPYQPPEDTAEVLPGSAKGTDETLRSYEREIVHLDRLLADFVDRLEKLGPAEDLLLVITADHGEEFQEHGSFTHLQLYDEVMQIPMFLRWPGRVPEDTRIETPVSLVDIVPTLLEFVGAAPPAGDGVSLLPLLEGATIARDVVYGQSTKSALQQRQRRYVARTEKAKCMVRHDDETWAECFDLVADPLEKNPIPPESRPDLADLHRKALTYRAKDLGEPTDDTKPAEHAPAEADLDPARREKLRMLGYIE